MRTLTLLALALMGQAPVYAQTLTKFVDPFIGTGGHGHTYPGATVPFGMVQLSPDNGLQGWDWCSGYNFSSNVITGFSHTHLSGTGIGDWCDISVMPYVSASEAVPGNTIRFSHGWEKASPGYYKVLMDDGIEVELTASDRVGFHQYNFPANTRPTVLFNLGFHINWDTPEEVFLKQINDSTVIGHRYSNGWAQGQRVYFAARLSQPIIALDTSGRQAWKLIFKQGLRNLKMKVGLSATSEAKALLALNEIPHWNFSKARQTAEERWERELEKMVIQTTDLELKKKFYTALYHTCLAPVLYSDADGEYQNARHEVKQTKTPRYTVYSLWDTFRALNPLFTITQPGRYSDVINSMMSFYRENGLLPVWDLSTWETNTMTGYHAIPVLADAVLKKLPGLDAPAIYEAMKKSAMQDQRGTQFYREYGFVPQDKYGSSVTVTLEYAYDDWCIAQVAKMLGRNSDYQEFMQRAGSWKMLFDPATGFLRARNADGAWVQPFDPYYSEHDEKKAMYTEGNAWQHSFFVPQDVNGLMEAHGGRTKFVAFLDSLFGADSRLTGTHTSPDVSGMIGQYAHGNEPSHHIAYLYTLAGVPAKTQDMVHLIIDSMYHAAPEGYAGNEDCGQMSAWLVWSVMGMYPVNPASGEYVVGVPMVNQVKLKLPGGRTLTVIRRGNGHVKSITLNGRAQGFVLKHRDLMQGGILEFNLN